MERIKNQTLDEERALYNVRDAWIQNCRFDGPADGESALKECVQITAEDCYFNLRYPFWHVDDSTLIRCTLTENCRAALWYDKNMIIEDSVLNGIKALRECDHTTLKNCRAASTEFSWKCRGVVIDGLKLESEYPFLENSDMHIKNLDMKGKYSFQYVQNAWIENSVLDTKDAFWHSENVTVKNCIVKGEYLGWYSKNLKLINCRISGKQPFCYCENLVLKHCIMEDTDLCFERSTVSAQIDSSIDSIKNPLSGSIQARSIGKKIFDLDWIDPSQTRIEEGEQE